MAQGPGYGAALLWGSLGQGLTRLAGTKRADRKEREEIERADTIRREGLAREDEATLLDLALRYGASPSGAGGPVAAAPSAAGGSLDSVRPNVGMGTAIMGTQPAPAPSTAAPAPTVSFRGRTLTVDPSRSVAGLQAEQTRTREKADRDAEIARLVGVLTPVYGQSYGEQGGAIAQAVANGVDLSNLAYQPLSRDAQFGDAREKQRIVGDEQIRVDRATYRAPQPSSAPQVYTSTPGGILNQVTGQVTPWPEGAGPAQGQATEGERNKAGFYARAQNAARSLETLGGDYTPSTGYTLRRRIGNLGLGKTEEAFDQAAREFLTAVLRKDSQGTINDGEFAEYAAIYLPMPGDSPETLAQKARSRANAIDELRVGAGRAAATGSSYSPDNPFAGR